MKTIAVTILPEKHNGLYVVKHNISLDIDAEDTATGRVNLYYCKRKDEAETLVELLKPKPKRKYKKYV